MGPAFSNYNFDISGLVIVNIGLGNGWSPVKRQPEAILSTSELV